MFCKGVSASSVIMFEQTRFAQNRALCSTCYFQDSVLDVDLADLKDLLKECGMRPGELLEIKTYLAKKG